MDIKKISSFIPFPLQTWVSEENTLEFYDINYTPFLKEFDDLSDELLICHWTFNVPQHLAKIQ